jgi:DNA-binding transcriptional LysR family regulator
VIRGIGYVDTRPHHLWMAEAAPRAKIAHRANSSVGIHEAVLQGLGIGSLMTAQADREPDLVRVRVGPCIAADAWLITSEASRLRPHVRAFLDFIAPRIVEQLREPTTAAP